MSEIKKPNKAVDWLKKFSEEIDIGMIDNMPIDEIRWQLHTSVGEVKKYHQRIAKLLNINSIKQGTKDIVKWISPIWKPKWSGKKITSGSIPKQSQIFNINNGKFNIYCHWQNKTNNKPALIEISWEANITTPCEFWVQFLCPDTQQKFATVKLGTNLAGKKTFSSETLGFDFSNIKWALSVIFKDLQS